MRPRNAGALVFAMALTGLAAPPPSRAATDSGALEIAVRDSATGFAVASAAVTLRPQQGDPLARSLSDGRSALFEGLAPGRVDVDVTAVGQVPMASHFVPEPGRTLRVTFWLDPLALPAELTSEAIRARLRPGQAFLHGHLSDEATGRPLPDVTVRLRRAAVEARTDAGGYFALHAPASPFATEQDMPTLDDLVFERRGYVTRELANTFLPEGGETHYTIQLAPGEGRVFRDDTHKLLRRDPFAGDDVRLLPEPPGLEEPSGGGRGVSLPGNIRVGTSCDCRDCSGVSVRTLGGYTKKGVCDEWIASWHMNSLRAGTVAYRSYGAWHVANPIAGNYDICSTGCCQVFNADDDSDRCANAGEDTAGIVVTRNCDRAGKAYYSAENNAWDNPNDDRECTNTDLSCADGEAGSPDNGWPCLTDRVCENHGCFGHGLGMCQWGTQRHANNGRSWRWITNHYYNGNGQFQNLRDMCVSDSCPNSNCP